jgi:hypothetical protein
MAEGFDSASVNGVQETRKPVADSLREIVVLDGVAQKSL